MDVDVEEADDEERCDRCDHFQPRRLMTKLATKPAGVAPPHSKTRRRCGSALGKTARVSVRTLCLAPDRTAARKGPQRNLLTSLFNTIATRSIC